MRIVRKILFAIVILFGLILIIALFVDGTIDVKREVTIKKGNQEVFDYIRLLKNQKNFSYWETIDPEMKRKYKGTDGEVGSIYSWDSQNKDAGQGEQEIKKITNGKRIDVELRFIRPFEATNQCYFLTQSLPENKTKVTWGFMKYPINFFCLFMDMDKKIGTDLQKGLDNLKQVLEKE